MKGLGLWLTFYGVQNVKCLLDTITYVKVSGGHVELDDTIKCYTCVGTLTGLFQEFVTGADFCTARPEHGGLLRSFLSLDYSKKSVVEGYKKS